MYCLSFKTEANIKIVLVLFYLTYMSNQDRILKMIAL